jgi:hypothetical protein
MLDLVPGEVRVHVWPQRDALVAISLLPLIRFQPVPHHRPLNWQPTVPTGARHALESDAKAVSLVPQFRQASSTAEVAEVLRRVREQHWRMAAGSQSQDNGDGQQHPPALGSMPDTLSTYLPFFYDLQPVDSDWGQQQVEEKRIWVLESQSNGGCHEGVLVMAPSVEGRRWTAGTHGSRLCGDVSLTTSCVQ